MTTGTYTGSTAQIVRNDLDTYEGDLVHYFQAVFYHAENLTNPYHNFRHLAHVLYQCHEACIYYGDRLTPRDKRNLLIAALFHDFDHTGTFGPDETNIERAILGFATHLLREDEAYADQIAELIQLTQYPYTTPSEELHILGQIIRDADMTQALSVAWIQQIVFGLAKEWRKTPLEVLRMQGTFFFNLKFQTEWAQKLYSPEVIRAKIAEAHDLIEVLTRELVVA